MTHARLPMLPVEVRLDDELARLGQQALISDGAHDRYEQMLRRAGVIR